MNQETFVKKFLVNDQSMNKKTSSSAAFNLDASRPTIGLEWALVFEP